MIATETKRIAMAPNVPQKIAFLRKSGGKRFAAMPITSALSPAKTRSIKIMARTAQTAFRDKKSMGTPF